MRVTELVLRNFLSYREASLDLGDLTALVGPNAAGKSNAVTAVRLLREIPTFGLQTAIARRGGFDQLRHRSEGRPYDPSLVLRFQVEPDLPESTYELHLGAKKGKRYEVKLEKGEIFSRRFDSRFAHKRGAVKASITTRSGETLTPPLPSIPAGQSALPVVSPGSEDLWALLRNLQTVEIEPSRLGGLQEPSPGTDFEPDGSNAASFFEMLDAGMRRELVRELSAIVPDIDRIEPRHVADKLTLTFYQQVSGKTREFSAKQMSDGTLRAFGILTSLFQRVPPALVVIEEPERAIHLGALRTLVDILREHSADIQVLITTHSADMVDALDLDELRVVWMEGGASRIAPVAAHTRIPVQKGLITPGELLRSDALDPAVA
jgi:predicted ATPase